MRDLAFKLAKGVIDTVGYLLGLIIHKLAERADRT